MGAPIIWRRMFTRRIGQESHFSLESEEGT